MLTLPIGSRRHPHLVLGQLGRFRFSPKFQIPATIRNTHTHVIGRSGMGKSKFLEYCLLQDIEAGRGCGLIDPHALLTDDLLRLLLTQGSLDKNIRQRLIYVDPSRTDYVIPFNVLATDDSIQDRTAAILEAFRRTWPDSLREAPHFSNVVQAALITLIENNLTLMHMPKLLTDKEFREACLPNVDDMSVIEFWHDRYDKWGREAPLLRESTLNKVAAFRMNRRIQPMLGQQANHLDFRKIMDEELILLVDLGQADSETNRLIGNLITTGFELAMRRRKKAHIYNLTIDEFAGYVATEGSERTLAHVFSEGRKFKLGITAAHQNLSQLTPRMTDALGDVGTKIIFGVNRNAAEHLAKEIGRVDTEAIKRDPKTDYQHEVFSPMPEQWEQWTKRLQEQKPRQITVATRGRVLGLWTVPIPGYTAGDDDIEAIKKESLQRFGITYAEALRNLEASQTRSNKPPSSPQAFDLVPAA